MAFRTNKTPVLQTKSASGVVASFNTALAMPLVNGEFTIAAYQEGSGDPSPDNVRNIVPFNAINITKNCETVTVQLGQDVYGAIYNSVTGKLTLTHRKITIPINGAGWAFNVPNNFVWLNLGQLTSKRNSLVICNTIKSAPVVGEVVATQIASGRQSFFDGNIGVRVNPEEIGSLSQFAQIYGGSEVVYTLRTPIEIQLDPTLIETFNGSNNIFCDTGDTSVTYKDLDIAKRGNFREVFKLPS